MDDWTWVRQARGSRDWRDAQQRMARAIRGTPTAALDIAQALDDDLYRHGFDIALDALRRDAFVLSCQARGAEATRVAVELGARPPVQQPTPSPRPDYVRLRNAREIVGRRPPEEVGDLLRADLLRHDDPEFGLLLSHELVLRGSGAGPVASWYARWAERAAHPLAQLPLRLLDIEAGLGGYLPQYGAGNGSSWTGLPDLPAGRGPLGDLIPGVGIPAPVLTDLVAAPFQDWLDYSNGSVQVARYVLGDTFPADLPELRPDREAVLVPPARVVESLFSAASNGGAYSPSPGGALARLRVWTSLRALLGLPADLPVDEVAHAAADATWIQLATDDDWFEDVAWDVWLVVTDGVSVTTVAATDTD